MEVYFQLELTHMERTARAEDAVFELCLNAAQ